MVKLKILSKKSAKAQLQPQHGISKPPTNLAVQTKIVQHHCFIASCRGGLCFKFGAGIQRFERDLPFLALRVLTTRDVQHTYHNQR